MSGEILGHNRPRPLAFPSPTGELHVLTIFRVLCIDLRNIQSIILKRSVLFLDVLNSNWLFLKLNQFICNRRLVLIPIHSFGSHLLDLFVDKDYASTSLSQEQISLPLCAHSWMYLVVFVEI